MGHPHPLGRLIAVTGKLVNHRFDAALADEGASLHVWILLLSAMGGGPPSQRDLAQRMSIESPTLVHHLDRLEADGLVVRRRDPDDRRVVRVEVTPEGEALFQRLRAVAADMEAELRSLFTDREQATLRELLQKVHAHYCREAPRDRAR